MLGCVIWYDALRLAVYWMLAWTCLYVRSGMRCMLGMGAPRYDLHVLFIIVRDVYYFQDALRCLARGMFVVLSSLVVCLYRLLVVHLPICPACNLDDL